MILSNFWFATGIANKGVFYIEGYEVTTLTSIRQRNMRVFQEGIHNTFTWILVWRLKSNSLTEKAGDKGTCFFRMFFSGDC